VVEAFGDWMADKVGVKLNEAVEDRDKEGVIVGVAEQRGNGAVELSPDNRPDQH